MTLRVMPAHWSWVSWFNTEVKAVVADEWQLSITTTSIPVALASGTLPSAIAMGCPLKLRLAARTAPKRFA